MNIKKILGGGAAGALMLGSSIVPAFADTTVLVSNLQPNWTAIGGGGVYSAYYGPPTYDAVSPGTTAVYDGRSAGIIKAGISIDADGHYWDEGLLGFKVPLVNVSTFASQTLTYDVENQSGPNPVWVRIRLVDGIQYQFVPTTNPAGWHTVNAAAGMWQLMDNDSGNAIGSLMTLSQVASADPDATVDRVYLTLGMGDSYNVSSGIGTVGWIDKVTIGGVTYDFVVVPASKDQCKNNSWKNLSDANGNLFKNQGDCVSFVATKGRNLPTNP